MIQKTKVKGVINRGGIQVTGTVLNQLDRYFSRLVDNITEQAQDGGIKRLTSDVNVNQLIENFNGGSLNNNGEKPKVKCDRCVGIRDVYLKWAREIRDFVADEAKIMLGWLDRRYQ